MKWLAVVAWAGAVLQGLFIANVVREECRHNGLGWWMSAPFLFVWVLLGVGLLFLGYTSWAMP